MKAPETTTRFELADPEILVKIKKIPSIRTLFLKVLFLSLVRPDTLDDNMSLSKVKVVFDNVRPDTKKIQQYKRICGFTPPINMGSNENNQDTTIPISYFQTLFVGLLGKFITTAHFPIKPMGLIQIGQSFRQKRPVTTDEILDLSCQLYEVTKTPKGIITQFLLEVESDNIILWQGISTFFTRSKNKLPKGKGNKRKEEAFLEIKETIFVPRNTGIQYASVSGDYNPHHLYGFTAKMIGFKDPIAHGMWSLARVIASMEKQYGAHYPLEADAQFKLPIFMPAAVTLGQAPAKTITDKTKTDKIRSVGMGSETRIDFELRDARKGLPHLKGRFAFNLKG